MEGPDVTPGLFQRTTSASADTSMVQGGGDQIAKYAR
jgi:hypothetical protein